MDLWFENSFIIEIQPDSSQKHKKMSFSEVYIGKKQNLYPQNTTDLYSQENTIKMHREQIADFLLT